jgi:hypothetical protein
VRDPHQRPKSGGKEDVHTESIRANVVTSETVHLRNITAMNGAKVEEVLPALPH